MLKYLLLNKTDDFGTRQGDGLGWNFVGHSLFHCTFFSVLSMATLFVIFFVFRKISKTREFWLLLLQSERPFPSGRAATALTINSFLTTKLFRKSIAYVVPQFQDNVGAKYSIFSLKPLIILLTNWHSILHRVFCSTTCVTLQILVVYHGRRSCFTTILQRV